MIDHLGTQPSPGVQISTAIGYVYIPKEVDRDSFVETCMRKGVCSVVRENSFGVMENVKISSEDIQLIDWPETTGSLGSPVVLVLEPFKKLYSVVAVLASDGSILQAKEGQRIISKETDSGRVSVILDATKPQIQILSEGGKIEVISRGGDVNIKSNKQITAQSPVQINVNAPKIVHNQGEEPMLRGQLVVDLFEELINLLFQARTATSIGLQPLNNFAQINALKQKLEELKSTKSFLE